MLHSQLVLGHFDGGSSCTIPTTNSMVFLLEGALAYGCLPLNGLCSFNRLPTKEQRPIQTFFLLGFITPLTKSFPLSFLKRYKEPPEFLNLNLTFSGEQHTVDIYYNG